MPADANTGASPTVFNPRPATTGPAAAAGSSGHPASLGLPTGRRRTLGLRREELAQIAGVSVSWYTWLEQGRPINASTDVLDALARALRLDPVERDHLLALAGHPLRDPVAPGRDTVPDDTPTSTRSAHMPSEKVNK